MSLMLRLLICFPPIEFGKVLGDTVTKSEQNQTVLGPQLCSLYPQALSFISAALVIWALMFTVPSLRSDSGCKVCHSLERTYQNAVQQINSIAETRFDSLSSKVRQLHKWQDIRTDAIEAFYEHKKTHGH
jgi:hypothetical protein